MKMADRQTGRPPSLSFLSFKFKLEGRRSKLSLHCLSFPCSPLEAPKVGWWIDPLSPLCLIAGLSLSTQITQEGKNQGKQIQSERKKERNKEGRNKQRKEE
mmetsp:Transcript_13395/g.26487  ORF Transcript_13395/g.26487 Transcript_13395/m.26487 type:complete len:101 (+) Transcript_13395:633-935(+)